MASGNGNQNDHDFSFHPQSGNIRYPWSSGTSRDTNRSNRLSNTNDRRQEQQQESFRNNNCSSQDEFHGVPVSRQKPMDDETNAYAVNLKLKPVEMGVIARNNKWQQKFQGLGAFNHYFGLCASTSGLGYTLPDIWDGYFHITLAKFINRLAPDQLEEVFRKFNPSLEDLPYIPDIVFRASSIKIFAGGSRGKKRRRIDFVVLPIDSSPEVEAFHKKVQSLLEKIKQQADPRDWNVTPCSGLHVTIRKYSNINFQLNEIKIQNFPLEFRCSHLEVKQPRQQATYRYEKEKKPWWIDVTEINGRCSGCGTRVMLGVWKGFCLACGKYESMRSLWSTTGNNARHHSLQQEQTQDDMQSELVQRITLNEL
jgi:hypothetical protein